MTDINKNVILTVINWNVGPKPLSLSAFPKSGKENLLCHQNDGPVFFGIAAYRSYKRASTLFAKETLTRPIIFTKNT